MHSTLCSNVTLLLAALLLLPAAACAFSLGGHLKALGIETFDSQDAFPVADRALSTQLRLDGTHAFDSGALMELSVEARLLGLSPARLLIEPSEAVNRRFDLDFEHTRGSWRSTLELDRMSLEQSHGDLRLRLGRQAIGFGRIALFSPLDVIAPFPPDALDTEVRPGIDALRLSYWPGPSSEVELIGVLGDEAAHNSLLLTATRNIFHLDLLLLAGELRGRRLLGLGVAGELFGMALRAESCWYRGTDVGQFDGDPKEHFSIWAFEAGYLFGDDFSVTAQYLHNGVGTNDPALYGATLLSAPLREGLIPLAGRQYLLASFSDRLHPLVTGHLLYIRNLGDDSAMVRPQLEISLADEVALSLFVTLHHGDRVREGMIPVQESEFGDRWGSAGAFLRFFF